MRWLRFSIQVETELIPSIATEGRRGVRFRSIISARVSSLVRKLRLGGLSTRLPAKRDCSRYREPQDDDPSSGRDTNHYQRLWSRPSRCSSYLASIFQGPQPIRGWGEVQHREPLPRVEACMIALALPMSTVARPYCVTMPNKAGRRRGET